MGWPEALDSVTGNSSGPIAKTILGVPGFEQQGVRKGSYAADEHSRRGNLTKEDAMSNLQHKSMVQDGKDSALLLIGTIAVAGGMIYGAKKIYDAFATPSTNNRREQ